MRLVLAVLAIVASVVLLGWIALHDPKRLAAQGVADRPTLGTRQRRVLALSAVVPGLLLMLSGWWSSAMMWMGATVILLWLWVLWLSRRTTHAAVA
jgi:hypothetical protein